MPTFRPFSNEQARLLVNLRQRYDSWMDVERERRSIPYDLRKKAINGQHYLYRITDRSGNGKSLGPWNEEREAEFAAYHAQKANLKERLSASRTQLAESAALYRALRLPLLSSDAGPILRECDRRSLLGSHLLVVGTNAIAAYMIEAAGQVLVPDETEDFDIAWVAEKTAGDDSSAAKTVWDMLKAVDSTFTVNSERDFQARNAKAYEVELLVAPSRSHSLARADKPRPVALPEQEWLLLGRPVDQVVSCRDGSPARIVAPDPRWFALHKLWMSQKPARNPLKRPKDRKQGLALLDLVAAAMPHYSLGPDFEVSLPAELVSSFAEWKAASRPAADLDW